MVVYESGIVEERSNNACKREVQNEAGPIVATPTVEDPCAFNKLVKMFKSMRIHIGLKGLVSEDKGTAPDRVIILSLFTGIQDRNEKPELRRLQSDSNYHGPRCKIISRIHPRC